MRYLVTGKYNEPGPMLPPDRVAAMLEEIILPSLKILAQWEADGTMVAGGVQLTSRTGTMIIEAASNDALDKMVAQLPFWGMLTWTAVPLTSFAERAKVEGDLLADLKKRLAG